MRSLVVGEPASYVAQDNLSSSIILSMLFEEPAPVTIAPKLTVLAAALLAVACSKNPLQVTRNPCPAVAVPAYTGDVTLFSRPGTSDADAIDVVAAMTNVRGTCAENSDRYVTDVSFDVLARRNDTASERTVTLPYFVTVVRGGDQLVSKVNGHVAVHFAAGQDRAQTRATAQATVLRSAATLPADIHEKITRERRPGDEDAAVDPLADPQIRAAVRSASFEVLAGFQLDNAQLSYNATK